MISEKVIEAIIKQVDAASPILQRLTYIKALPGGLKAGGAQALAEVCYDSAALSELEEMVSRWQYATKAILSLCFGADSEHTRTFETTIVGDHVIYKDAKEELTREVKAGRNALSAIIDAESLKSGLQQQNAETAKPKEQPQRPPKVFISHKKEDKAYADALVNLINILLGTDGDKIFCSSIPGYGIRQSRDILEELKNQFDCNDIFMVIIHSPRYYQSAICLNEMGASWALGTKFSSFMTIDCKPEYLHGVINREKICIDLNDDDDMLNCHLNEFKDDLIDFFHAGQIDQNRWENARGRFIREVKALTYESPASVPSPASEPSEGIVNTIDTTVSFTEEEFDVLRQWVESGNNSAHVLGALGGKSFVFGNIQYFAENGRQEAYWKAFLKKLLNMGFIEIDHYDSHGTPVYELQYSIYEYFGMK